MVRPSGSQPDNSGSNPLRATTNKLEACMKKKEERIEETQEQKEARWNKQNKQAKAFAKMAGIDMKKIKREREHEEFLHRLARAGY